MWLNDLLSAEVNDLLLNSDRGAGGVVVSKEEVDVGIKVAQKRRSPLRS
jgi:hypothetical protein